MHLDPYNSFGFTCTSSFLPPCAVVSMDHVTCLVRAPLFRLLCDAHGLHHEPNPFPGWSLVAGPRTHWSTTTCCAPYLFNKHASCHADSTCGCACEKYLPMSICIGDNGSLNSMCFLTDWNLASLLRTHLGFLSMAVRCPRVPVVVPHPASRRC